jgi:3-oxoacyl-[acyl-carrier protein] reductase
MERQSNEQGNRTSTTADTLKGQVAVITGGSRGIGRAIAIELAAAGAHVLVHTGHQLSAAQQVSEQIRAGGRDSLAVQRDLTDDAASMPLVDEAWSWRNGVDIWVNNAGADVLTTPAARWSFEDRLHLLWQIDVLGTIRLSRLVGDRMLSRGGVILNVGWDQAEIGMAGDSGQMFATAKGAVMAFTRSLAHTLAPTVRVNCLAPGWIKTAWGETASDYWQQRAIGNSLLRRWGTPEDVAHVARFLASPAAAFLTGQTIAINGGLAGPGGLPSAPDPSHSS